MNQAVLISHKLDDLCEARLEIVSFFGRSLGWLCFSSTRKQTTRTQLSGLFKSKNKHDWTVPQVRLRSWVAVHGHWRPLSRFHRNDMASSSTACTTGTAFPLCGGEFPSFIGWDTKFGANFGDWEKLWMKKSRSLAKFWGSFFASLNLECSNIVGFCSFSFGKVKGTHFKNWLYCNSTVGIPHKKHIGSISSWTNLKD